MSQRKIDNLKPYFLYIGNAYPHKNLERLMISFNLLHKNYPKYQLVLVGAIDCFYQKIQGLSKVLGLKNRVIFWGKATDQEIDLLYQDAEAYIFPSLSEGFGLPGLEAMKRSCPLLSSSQTCLPEIYGPAALYFNPYNEQEILTAMLEIINHPKLSKKLIQSGLKQVQKYSWEKCARETIENYQEVLREIN